MKTYTREQVFRALYAISKLNVGIAIKNILKNLVIRNIPFNDQYHQACAYLNINTINGKKSILSILIRFHEAFIPWKSCKIEKCKLNQKNSRNTLQLKEGRTRKQKVDIEIPPHPRSIQRSQVELNMKYREAFQSILEYTSTKEKYTGFMTLQDRLLDFQKFYMNSIKELKHGCNVRVPIGSDTFKKWLNISSAGEFLQVRGSEKFKASESEFYLPDIAYIQCHKNLRDENIEKEIFRFSIKFRKEKISSQDIYCDSNHRLRKWVLTLISVASAFQLTSQQQNSETKTIEFQQMIWQAVRLRVYELSKNIDFYDAVSEILNFANVVCEKKKINFFCPLKI